MWNPGMEKDDCRIMIEGNLLCLSGEKRLERETSDSTYHVMERAYGAFQRTIPLPRNVDASKAEASCKNGVLSIRLPKVAGESPELVRGFVNKVSNAIIAGDYEKFRLA